VKLTKEQKKKGLDTILLVLVLGNMWAWPQVRDFYLPAPIPQRVAYVFTDTHWVPEPSPYVPVDGVRRAQEFCLGSGGIATLKGLVPHQGDKTAYVRCENGDEHLF